MLFTSSISNIGFSINKIANAVIFGVELEFIIGTTKLQDVKFSVITAGVKSCVENYQKY
ncbi:hypothetical protein GCM10011339_20980 [Echinicola rosea]|uniref:Uncharacterized protein n=1 Tax=Echinicola rosea TaxID=1807691 RepID=A0ABQ1V1U2_9BACT|nr:hypothetical protein GCM10011339_20980 [Echinicola rosea]